MNASSLNAEKKKYLDQIYKLMDKEIYQNLNSNTPINPFEFAPRFNERFFTLAYEDRLHPNMKNAVELLSKCDYAYKAAKMERSYLFSKLGQVKGMLEQDLEAIKEKIKKL